MNISAASNTSNDMLRMSQLAGSPNVSAKDVTAKQAFQQFVGGTFYQQMLKALRSTEQKVQYLDAGQAEEAFRNQLDQQLAQDLAASHGAAFSDSLYEAFEIGLKTRMAEKGTQIDQLA